MIFFFFDFFGIFYLNTVFVFSCHYGCLMTKCLSISMKLNASLRKKTLKFK